jgi:hypothetical protein
MPFFGFDRVMACSREDLARWLREFAGADHGLAQTGHAELQFDWGTLRIDTESLPPHRIALLRIRQLRVRFTPSEGAQDAARAWLTGFDRHTQRGGG